MDRRRFFQRSSGLLSIAYAAFLAIPGVGFLISPLREARKKSKQHRLAKLADLEIDQPLKVVVTDQRIDAWTRYPKGPIGSVWIVRRDDQTVEAFSATCPHLGCAVQHVPTEEQFYCPCHEARFNQDGAVKSGPSRRGLDKLEVDLEPVGEEIWVTVRFQKFELGSAEKIALS